MFTLFTIAEIIDKWGGVEWLERDKRNEKEPSSVNLILEIMLRIYFQSVKYFSAVTIKSFKPSSFQVHSCSRRSSVVA